MKHRIVGLGLAALLAGGAYPAHAQDLTPINVSYQPALYWALPFYLATEMGWWEEVGLEPSFEEVVEVEIALLHLPGDLLRLLLVESGLSLLDE